MYILCDKFEFVFKRFIAVQHQSKYGVQNMFSYRKTIVSIQGLKPNLKSIKVTFTVLKRLKIIGNNTKDVKICVFDNPRMNKLQTKC